MSSADSSFLSHLVAVLSIYELAPLPSSSSPPSATKSPPVPRWDGERTWETDAILHSLSVIGDRLGFSQPQQSSVCVEEIVEDKTEPPDLQNGHQHHPTKLPLPSQRMPTQPSHICYHCGYPLSGYAVSGDDPTNPPSSPLGVVPPGGPLAMAAMESGMSAVEELRLLKASVQDVARVCNAVARGDLSQKITVKVQGIVMVQLKDVINGMVDKLSQFSKEVTRVSVEVGTEGKLGGQALVLDVEGTWRELTGVVNKLAANLTNQVCLTFSILATWLSLIGPFNRTRHQSRGSGRSIKTNRCRRQRRNLGFEKYSQRNGRQSTVSHISLTTPFSNLIRTQCSRCRSNSRDP